MKHSSCSVRTETIITHHNTPQHSKHPDFGIYTDGIDTENASPRQGCIMVMQQLIFEGGYNVLRGNAESRSGGQRKQKRKRQ
jgi:hypothetical protein